MCDGTSGQHSEHSETDAAADRGRRIRTAPHGSARTHTALQCTFIAVAMQRLPVDSITHVLAFCDAHGLAAATAGEWTDNSAQRSAVQLSSAADFARSV